MAAAPAPPQVPLHQALREKLRGDTVHVCLFGLADAGKSCAFNFMCYLLKGSKFVGGRSTGGGTLSGGQHSTTCAREYASFYLTSGEDPSCWNVAKDGDLIITDSVGFRGDESELMAIGNGKLKEVEGWPRDDSPDSLYKRVEILDRKPLTVRPSLFVLFISAQQVLNPGKKELDDIVMSIMEHSRSKFRAGEFQVEMPLYVVITKADLVAEPQDLLLQRTSAKLKEVFSKCTNRFGVSKDNMYALGFLDESDITDFSATTKDPRALAVRNLILAMAEGAQIKQRALARHEPDMNAGFRHPALPVAAATNNFSNNVRSNNNNNNNDNRNTGNDIANDDDFDCDDDGSASFVTARTNRTDGATRLAEWEKLMKEAPSRKSFIESLNKEQLLILLQCKNVNDSIRKIVDEKGFGGGEFADDAFVEVLIEEKVNPLILRTFVSIRNELLGIKNN